MNAQTHGAGPAPRVRPRTDGDIAACVRVLADVHRADGYPVNWPERPGDWLRGALLLGGWVAELGGRPAGHVSLSRPGDGDLAPGLWSEHTGTSPDRTAVVGRLFVAPRARGHGLGGVSPIRPGSRRLAPRLAALSSVPDAPHRLPPPPCDARHQT
ncbi:GNAT family N-acetyltransferase, partial [Streptomyces griseosporeus]|uniref:GNAT family N-acetyltransferase n=1 Tax=Streptomyces griseosporeus TaxID=1910 RepID=UPI0036AD6D48